jgi:hypothetical protein
MRLHVEAANLGFSSALMMVYRTGDIFTLGRFATGRL